MTLHADAHDPTPRVALETALPVMGVPRNAAEGLFDDLGRIITDAGAEPATVGLLDGTPIVGMSRAQILTLVDCPDVAKANTSNLGALIHNKRSAATTVSATIELAAGAGVRVMATGGIGGVHLGRFDVSADLIALTRFPVAVVCSGCKSILDVAATREALETLGVPVLGFRTDEFPAFYLRSSGLTVDARFDDEADLARFVATELSRTRRGLVVTNPIPEADAINPVIWSRWLAAASSRVAEIAATGRDATPALLAALHEISAGATLRANLSLVRANAGLAARVAARLG